MMQFATAKQLQSIHAALHSKGLLAHKREMVAGYTNGRTESSKDMTVEEAHEMLQALHDHQPGQEKKDKMIKHMIAMAHEMGWIKENTVVENGSLKKKKDYSDLHHWVLKYGYLKKPLNQYKYEELPTLVTAFKNVYQSWLQKIK